MATASVILKTSAPAKINLALKLVGKRQDGYHLLDSIFVPVNTLYDDILEVSFLKYSTGITPFIFLVNIQHRK